jgi:hypothetical protein
MSMGLCFWILMLLWLVFGLWPAPGAPWSWRGAAPTLLLFVLLLLLGWKTFGPPIHG